MILSSAPARLTAPPATAASKLAAPATSQLRAMPHLAAPIRHKRPLPPKIRFDSNAPARRLLAKMQPVARARGPNWLIKLRLMACYSISRQKNCPKRAALICAGRSVQNVKAGRTKAVRALKSRFARAIKQTSVWADDGRVTKRARISAARAGTGFAQDAAGAQQAALIADLIAALSAALSVALCAAYMCSARP